MTALTQTITNRLALFGPAPPDLWNAYLWNAFKWGEGTAPMVKAPRKVLSETLSLVDSFAKGAKPTISNSLAPTSGIDLENLRDGEGYFHVFPGGVTDGMDRVASTWAGGTATTTTWAASAATATTWSAA